ncbi:PREDICTED: zinc finger protein 830 [Fragaria vesca subsp. vesca]|uniref:zinc finger protein 830 n=1 Tax=Fragaria vesca subsp. vesca TaxID=101020 RepID=UPI0002C36AE0|nr:PREDICTED: zinc finger protein 830 [Fragaria vesca subsp. vesca]XP_011469488.1 PREDICTED: zinc finger protein 830 [Fragaria vesca subsp. vesca]
MDAKAKNKALFRAKLNAQKKEKRINSPLVRYNDSDQPLCKICDCVLRSESVWDAHQLSRKHKEAIINLRAAAGGSNRVNIATTEAHPELFKPNDVSLELEDPKPELLRPQMSSGLPPGFFDNQPQKQSTGSDSYSSVETDSYKRMQNRSIEPSGDFTQAASQSASSQAKQTKGALPEGFFDNKEADLSARGIKIVKPDVKDEYKEFEKLIQEDLKEVDNRLEEEEIDAAEMIEEAESVEQKTYREKVKLMRKKRMELKAANAAKRRKASDFVKKEEPSHEESSSDGDSDENFAVDWRAQHL